VRKAGAGRKPLAQTDPTLLQHLEQLVDPDTRGEPTSALLWTSKSTRKLSDELKELGHHVSTRTVAHLLQSLEYSLQGNRKNREGKQHPDRAAQFRYINKNMRSFQRKKQLVISVDAKHRELGGLQQLANELKLRITVCHFPPGTSKRNKIEHRMFCHVTQNWRG